MTSAVLSPKPDERWLSGASPIRRMSATMALFIVASLAIHAVVLGTAVLTGGAPAAAPQQDIAVEIVHDIPEAAKPQPKLPAPYTPPDIAKTEPVKLEPPKPAPPPARTPEPQKAEEQARREPPPVAKADDGAAKLAALQKEFESLKAEQAALEAERAATQAQAAAQVQAQAEARAQAQAAPSRATGLGPLPDSFQAVALPMASDGVGEAVGYQEIVFSALAKAKGIGGTRGLPGSAGVHFEIDAMGRLVSVELVHRSGVASLDKEALDIVRRAAPFPPPPQGAQRSFDANVNFVTESAR